jgi:hypothetical protein
MFSSFVRLMHSHRNNFIPININTINNTVNNSVNNKIIKYVPHYKEIIPVNNIHDKIHSCNTNINDVINSPYFHRVYTKHTYIMHILDLYKK